MKRHQMNSGNRIQLIQSHEQDQKLQKRLKNKLPAQLIQSKRITYMEGYV